MRTGQSGVTAVVLEEQGRRFAYDKTKPIKGILQMSRDGNRTVAEVSIDNLQRRREAYQLFFIGRKDGRSVYKMVGEIIPDRNGTAALRTIVETDNVDGNGTELSNFFIFIIAAAGTPLRPVLKGDLAGGEHTYNKENSRDAAVRKDSGMEKSGDAVNREQTYHKKKKMYNSYYNEYIRQKTGALMSEERAFSDISPFDDVWLSDNWKRVTDPVRLPVASAGAEQQILRYGHFIFAYNDNNFLLAVPGRHTAEEWPDRGESGFCMWQSIRNSSEYGYWCMVIDWKAGIITEIS